MNTFYCAKSQTLDSIKSMRHSAVKLNEHATICKQEASHLLKLQQDMIVADAVVVTVAVDGGDCDGNGKAYAYDNGKAYAYDNAYGFHNLISTFHCIKSRVLDASIKSMYHCAEICSREADRLEQEAEGLELQIRSLIDCENTCCQTPVKIETEIDVDFGSDLSEGSSPIVVFEKLLAGSYPFDAFQTSQGVRIPVPLPTRPPTPSESPTSSVSNVNDTCIGRPDIPYLMELARKCGTQRFANIVESVRFNIGEETSNELLQYNQAVVNNGLTEAASRVNVSKIRPRMKIPVSTFQRKTQRDCTRIYALEVPPHPHPREEGVAVTSPPPPFRTSTYHAISTTNAGDSINANANANESARDFTKVITSTCHPSRPDHRWRFCRSHARITSLCNLSGQVLAPCQICGNSLFVNWKRHLNNCQQCRQMVNSPNTTIPPRSLQNDQKYGSNLSREPPCKRFCTRD